MQSRTCQYHDNCRFTLTQFIVSNTPSLRKMPLPKAERSLFDHCMGCDNLLSKIVPESRDDGSFGTSHFYFHKPPWKSLYQGKYEVLELMQYAGCQYKSAQRYHNPVSRYTTDCCGLRSPHQLQAQVFSDPTLSSSFILLNLIAFSSFVQRSWSINSLKCS
jgi:hypothetical protein